MGTPSDVIWLEGFAPFQLQFLISTQKARHGTHINYRNIGGGLANLLRLIILLAYSQVSLAAFGPWVPEDPATGCSKDFSASGASASGWIYLAHSVFPSSTGETALCRAQCTDSAKCGTSTGVIGGYGRTYTRPLICPTGQKVVNGQCVKDDGCLKGLPQRGSVPFPGSVNTVCFSGCEATPIDTSNQYYCSGGSSAPTQCSVGTWEQTGASCPTGAPSASPAPPETQKCAAGTCPGTVNGVTTCLACTQNNSTTETSKSTSSQSDGTKIETTTSTTCQGEACTTTTSTKTTPLTGTPTVDTKTEPSTEKKSFCEENPTFSACKNGTFTGSCGSAPACTGDAVQCATARATFETNCTLTPAVSPLSTLGNSLASGTENLTGAGLSSQANREVVNLQTSLDTSKFLATGCPPDRIISLPKGQSITLPFSRLCGVFQFMGSIVIAFSLLAASRIVGVV